MSNSTVEKIAIPTNEKWEVMTKREKTSLMSQIGIAFSTNVPDEATKKQNTAWAINAKGFLSMANGLNISANVGDFAYGIGPVDINLLTVRNYDSETMTGYQRFYKQRGGAVTEDMCGEPSIAYSRKCVEIADKFDMKYFDPISINFHSDNGLMEVVDGAHRCFAAKARGISMLLAKVYFDLSDEEVGEMFCNQYKACTRIKSSENFFANISAHKDGPQAVVNAVCKDMGIVISQNKEFDACLNNFNTPVDIVERDQGGTNALRFCFSLLNNWTDKNRYEARFLKMASFIYFNRMDKQKYDVMVASIKKVKTSNEFVNNCKEYCYKHNIEFKDSRMGLSVIKKYVEGVYGYPMV